MIQFQLVDLLADDLPNDNDGKSFQVSLYGKTKDNKSIIVKYVYLKTA